MKKEMPKFREGEVVTAILTGRVYSVNQEGNKIFYGVEWQNARDIPTRTLHPEYTLKN